MATKAAAGRIRAQMDANGRLRLEFLAALSKLLREHGVEIEDVTLGELVLAMPEELTKGAV